MSKSLGNFITLAEALDKYSGPVLRLYYLQHHYRSPVNFAGERLGETIQAWNRVQTFVRNARGNGLDGADPHPALMKAADEAFDDDLNTPQVVSLLFDAVREGNKALANEDAPLVSTYLNTVEGLAFQLGLDLTMGIDGAEHDTHLTDLVDGLLAMRATAKAEKNFALADQIRDLLDEAHIQIEDRRDGTSWKAR